MTIRPIVGKIIATGIVAIQGLDGRDGIIDRHRTRGTQHCEHITARRQSVAVGAAHRGAIHIVGCAAEAIDTGRVLIGHGIVSLAIACARSRGICVTRDEIPLISGSSVTASGSAGRSDDGRGAALAYRLGAAVDGSGGEGGIGGNVNRGHRIAVRRVVRRTHRVGAGSGDHRRVVARRCNGTDPLVGDTCQLGGRQRGGSVRADGICGRRDGDLRQRIHRHRHRRTILTSLGIRNDNLIFVGSGRGRGHRDIGSVATDTRAPSPLVAGGAAILVCINSGAIACTNLTIGGSSACRDHQSSGFTQGDVGRGRTMVGIRGRHRVVASRQACGLSTDLRRRGTPRVGQSINRIGHRGRAVFAAVTARIVLGDDRRSRLGGKGDRHIGRVAVAALVGGRHHHRGVGENLGTGIRRLGDGKVSVGRATTGAFMHLAAEIGQHIGHEEAALVAVHRGCLGSDDIVVEDRLSRLTRHRNGVGPVFHRARAIGVTESISGRTRTHNGVRIAGHIHIRGRNLNVTGACGYRRSRGSRRISYAGHGGRSRCRYIPSTNTHRNVTHCRLHIVVSILISDRIGIVSGTGICRNREMGGVRIHHDT